MAADDSWISIRITEALATCPLVSDAVSSRIADLLKGDLSERQLSKPELTSVAKALIVDMASVSLEADGTK